MKSIILLAGIILSAQSFAKDMSRTETYDEAYRDTKEGYSEYIGKCSTHQDYEK